MSSIDLVILGIVSEGPKSAYDIQKDVEYHHFSRWTQISVPSVYRKVLQLRDKGYLSSQPVKGERATEKSVYSITAEGRAELRRLLEVQAAQPVPLLFDFNVLIANLNKLSREEALALLDTLRESLQASAQTNREYAAAYPDIPLVGRTIFDQQRRLYDALLEWLDDFTTQFSGDKP